MNASINVARLDDDKKKTRKRFAGKKMMNDNRVLSLECHFRSSSLRVSGCGIEDYSVQ